ncbi:rCG22645 [Rattus norvegicus]|uniref:RCG22645 n=1 Tax=Rattus norvegicus TaxID=10116 RepID=A6KNI9_RAT|nr:rCG22645 [Rattus norvegicus]
MPPALATLSAWDPGNYCGGHTLLAEDTWWGLFPSPMKFAPLTQPPATCSAWPGPGG